MEEEIRVPVYLVNGFLESGKTTFLSFTISQEYFDIDELTLLILCEEGEEEYDGKMLRQHDTVSVAVPDEKTFGTEFLQNLEDFYQPGRVIIEYNGMWPTGDFYKMELPEGWGVIQQITTIDATTCQIYMNNMKSQFMDMVRGSEMVMFNRCTLEQPLLSFRRNIRAVNQQAEILFEDENGVMDNLFADIAPFNMDADIIDIPDSDYGIWYLDALENTERYKGKTVRFRAKVMKDRRRLGQETFVPGRMAMACCEEDTSFIGFVCKTEAAKDLKNGQWVMVTAKVDEEYVPAYKGVGPVLLGEKVEPAESIENDMVTFS